MKAGRALSTTLSLYIARRFLWWFIAMFGGLFGVIFMGETIELLRRAADRSIGFAVVAQMAAWKTPYTVQEILPFSLLGGAMATFWHLNRTSELIVARSVGVSAWQFLLPAAATALLIGILRVTVLDPVTAAMTQRFEQLEARYLTGSSGLVTASGNGLWLRQTVPGGQAIIHADRITIEDRTFHRVSILNFGGDDRFLSRIDAPTARLAAGAWRLPGAWVAQPNRPGARAEEYALPTTLTIDQVVDSLTPSKTISFWRLPRYIKILEATGFSSLSHRLLWHRLLATPLLLVAMVFLAAPFTLRPQRMGRTMLLVSAGVTIGFLLYFLSNLIYRLGLSGSIPLELAAWTPAGLTLLVGITLLLHLEDG
jgi:lipopolysaccharide export system permease protein